MIGLAVLTGLASSVFMSWWLYTVDWRLGTAFVTLLATLFMIAWNEQEE